VVRDLRIPPDTRLVGSSPCLIPGVHRDQTWRLTRGPSYEGFGRRPLTRRRAGSGAGVRKPPREETAGRLGTVWRARLWGFVGRGRRSSEASATRGGRCFRRKRRRLASLIAAMRGSEGFASVEGGQRRSRGRRVRVRACGLRRKRSTLRGGMRGDGHELSMLIRVGDGERQGRGPSNVSTTIIRPPQQGQRCAGGTSST
jgi:hypothetical protein